MTQAFTSDAAFLAAITAEPANESLRHVYADWLEEHGDERHQFLRAESQLTGMVQGDRDYTLFKKLVGRLRRSLDANWLTRLDDARKRSGRTATACHACGRRLTAKEAISIHPRTRLKLKTRRYCGACWENAVRNDLREEFSRERFDPNSVVSEDDS